MGIISFRKNLPKYCRYLTNEDSPQLTNAKKKKIYIAVVVCTINSNITIFLSVIFRWILTKQCSLSFRGTEEILETWRDFRTYICITRKKTVRLSWIFSVTYVTNANCKSRRSEIQDESRRVMPSSEDVRFATAIRIRGGITRRRGKNGRKGRNDGRTRINGGG